MSMNVQAQNASQLAQVYAQMLTNQGLEGVSVTASEDGSSLTVTANDKDGVAQTTTVNLPTLETAEGLTEDQMVSLLGGVNDAIAGFVADLGALSEEQTQALTDDFNALLQETYDKLVNETSTTSTSSSSSTKSAVFSIYAVLQLLMEISLEQRNAARVQRQADNAEILNAIQGQADQMKDDALAGMISAVCVAVIQGGMLAGSSVAEHKANSAESQTRKMNGVDTQAKIEKMTAECANDPTTTAAMKDKAAAKVNSLEAKIQNDPSIPAQDKAQMKGAAQRIEQNSNPVSKAQGELDAATSKLEAFDKAHPGGDNLTGDLKGERDVLVQSKNDAQVKLDDAKGMASSAADPKAPGHADTHNEFMKSTGDAYNDAKAEWKSAHSQYQTEARNGTVSESTKLKMEYANAKLEYAAACKLDAECGTGGVATAAEKETFMNSVKNDYESAYRSAEGDPMMKVAEGKHRMAKRVGDANQIAGNLVQQLSIQGGQLRQSETKLEEKNVEEARMKRDETNDLLQSASDLYKTVSDSIQAIRQTENQTFHQIMG